MPNLNVLPLDRLSRPWRRAIILLGCAGAIGGLGCATMLAAGKRNPRADAHFYRPVLTDTIFALGRADEKLARKIGNEHAVAFLGRRHTYLLLDGGEKLLRVAKELDGDRLELVAQPRSIFLSDKTLWGTITLAYQPVPGQASRAELLQDLGFMPVEEGSYRLSLPIQGVLYPPVKVGPELEGRFKQTRSIAFYNAPDSTPPPDLSKFVLVPLAVAVDVMLTPVYVGGLLLLVIAAN